MKMRIAVILLAMLSYLCMAEEKFSTRMSYTVRRVAENKPALTADWEAPAWQHANTMRLLSFFPESTWTEGDMRVRLLYDEDFIYGIVKMKDRYMQSEKMQTNTFTCTDSCAEFFFSPGGNMTFFNVEMNHAGVVLANFNLAPFEKNQIISDEDVLAYVKTKGSIPYLIKDEIEGPITWTLEFRIAREMIVKYLAPYMELPKNLGGTSWTCNFYHCADNSSHPRWIAWAQVPFLSFHTPEFFGIMKFEP